MYLMFLKWCIPGHYVVNVCSSGWFVNYRGLLYYHHINGMNKIKSDEGTRRNVLCISALNALRSRSLSQECHFVDLTVLRVCTLLDVYKDVLYQSDFFVGPENVLRRTLKQLAVSTVYSNMH